MADLRLLVPLPALGRLEAHAKATLTGQAVVLVFPYLDAEGDIADLARNWVEQERGTNKKPLTRPGSPKLAKVSLTAVFADPADAQTSVEPQLGFLRALAGSENPFVASFGGLLGDVHWTESGRWVMRECSIHVVARRHSDNAVTRAEAKLELGEANVPGWVPTPSTFRYRSEITGAGTGVRSWMVAEGDSLWAIAWIVYGDPARWRDIAAVNTILKPWALEPGTILSLP